MKDNYNTERLSLSSMNMNDAEFIFELVNMPGWIRFIGERNIRSKSDAENYIQKILDKPGAHYWVAKTKEENIPAGIITIIKRDYLEHPDFGFAFLEQYSGKGYATEASAVVLKDILNQNASGEVLAITVKENERSIHLLEKSGFTFQNQIHVENEFLEVYKITREEHVINELTKSFFSIFNNTNDRKPDWSILENTVIPEAIIIKKSGVDEEIYNLETFLRPRKKILSDGTLKNFKEFETSHETKISGQIAQRYSTYSKSGIMNGESFEQDGTKLFQFVKTKKGWKITSLVWEDK